MSFFNIILNDTNIDFNGGYNGVLDLSYGFVDISLNSYTTDATSVNLFFNGSTTSNIVAPFDIQPLITGDNLLSFILQGGVFGEITYNVLVHVQNNDTTLSVFDVSGIPVSDGSNVILPYGTSSVSVIATPTDASANADVSGNTGLLTGDNSLNVLVTAEDPSITDAYHVNLHVQNNDTTLSVFDVSGIPVSDGSNVILPYGTSSVSVIATPTDASANADVSGNTGLLTGDNSLNVLVTAEDPSIFNTYHVNLLVEKDEILTSLFVTNPISYAHDNSFNVGFQTTDVSMVYVTNDPSGSVTISYNGTDISFNNDSSSNIFGLNGLSSLHNPFTIKLTSQTGLTTKTYQKEIYVEPDVFLDLSINGTSLSNENTKYFTHGTSSFTAKYTTSDPSNVVWYRLNNDISHSFLANSTTTIPGLIDSSLNTFRVNISSYDLLTTKAYTYYLFVELDQVFVNFDISGSIIHYSSGSTYYNLKYNTKDISGYYVTSDPSSTVILDFSGNRIFTYPDSSSNVFSLTGLQPLNNTLNFTIQSHDGLTSKPDTRNVYVERDVSLTQFVITRPTLNYPYSANIIHVPYGTTDISGYYRTLNANYESGYKGGYTKFDFSGNVFDLSNNISGGNTFSISGLKPFNNDISLTVFSATGLTSETFSKRIYVEAEELLSNLAVDGVYFASGYIFNIPYGDHNVTLTFDIVENDPIDFPSYVNITVNGKLNTRVTSPFIATELDTGLNQIVILVSSEDNLTQKTYFLTVYVEASCLLEGTLVRTPNGYVPIETIQVGDCIRTLRYDIKVTKTGKWEVDMNKEEDRNDLSKKMYKIPAGSFDNTSNVFISHYHRILIEDLTHPTNTKGFQTPEKIGLPLANLNEFAPNGKFNLYHLEVEYGQYFMVNGGCIVEAWQPKSKFY